MLDDVREGLQEVPGKSNIKINVQEVKTVKKYPELEGPWP